MFIEKQKNDKGLETAKKHFQLGLTALSESQFSQAEKELRISNQVAPNRVSTLTNLSATLIHLGKFPESIEFSSQILEIEPCNLEALLNLGICKINLNEPQSAIIYFDKAIAIDPLFGSAWINKANLLLKQELLNDSAYCFNQAIKVNAKSEEALIGLGNLQNELKKYDQGIKYFYDVLTINPKNIRAKWNLALSLLRLGKYKEGWKLYESRWDLPSMQKNKISINAPLWLGQESLANKRILIHAEQGFGDTIQFSRYLNVLETTAVGEIIFEVPSQLTSIMQSISRSIDVVEAIPNSRLNSYKNIDFYCPIMSLPLALWNTTQNIPEHIPYLRSDPEKNFFWKEQLNLITASKKNPKVDCRPIRIGIAWVGSGHYSGEKSHKRDIPFQMIRNLIEKISPIVENIEFHSVQPIKVENQVLSTTNFFSHDNLIQDFSDTASLLCNLDLIISVDTAVAHLSGALGKRTLLLLADPPDYLAGLDEMKTPWYPNTKLIRQSIRNCWDKPLTEVANFLIKEFHS